MDKQVLIEKLKKLWQTYVSLPWWAQIGIGIATGFLVGALIC